MLLQFVSGAKVLTYWITAFIWDYITYFITILTLYPVFITFQEHGWSTNEELFRYFILLMAFGYSVLPITYIASRFFIFPPRGFAMMIIIFIFSGIIFSTIILMIHIFQIPFKFILFSSCIGMASFIIVHVLTQTSTEFDDKAVTLKWFFLFFPHFGLSHSIMQFYEILRLKATCQRLCECCGKCPGGEKTDICLIPPYTVCCGN